MTIEELFAEWEKDSEIDITKLDSESLNISKLHFKYYKEFFREKLRAQQLEADILILKKIKTEYYNGTLDQETIQEKKYPILKMKILKTDIPMYLESDEELIQLKLKLQVTKEKIDFLESIIKSLVNRGFNIKAAIDYIKFKNGV